MRILLVFVTLAASTQFINVQAVGETVSASNVSYTAGASASSLGISVGGFSDATNLIGIVALRQNGTACTATSTCGTLDIPSGNRTGLTLLYNHTYASVRLGVSGSKADVIAGIQAATYAPPATAATGITLSIDIVEKPSDTNMFYEPFNDHWYKKVESASSVTWTAARSAASGSTFNGLTGYLVNIVTADENNFIGNYTTATNIWTGGADAGLWNRNGDIDNDGIINVNDLDEEGEWRWVDGPEAGQGFLRMLQNGNRCARWGTNTNACSSLGSITYTVLNSNVNAWAGSPQGEPNQYFSYANMCATGRSTCTSTSGNMQTSDTKWPPGENALVTNWSGTTGKWNDLNQLNADVTVTNYLIEYGGVGTDTTLKASSNPNIKFNQSITFNDPGQQTGFFEVSPTATSGLTVTLASSTPSVCTVTDFTISKVSNGSCTITASQAGNSSWAAASDVARTFTFANSNNIAIDWTVDGKGPVAPTASTDATCTAGTATQFNISGYRVIRFNAPATGDGTCTWTMPSNVESFEALLVGGGGGGGYNSGGGGGGGHVRYFSNIPVTSTGSNQPEYGPYRVYVGHGGRAQSAATLGADSRSSVTTDDVGGTSLICTGASGWTPCIRAGGGQPGQPCMWNSSNSTCTNNSALGNNGGSGGTSAGTNSLAVTASSGGDGALKAVSTAPTNGAAGSSNSITGAAVTYAGGGGGGARSTFAAASGGAGGGGAGGANGTAGLGGGGGGGAENSNGGAGGSGVVIIRYSLRQITNSTSIAVNPAVTSGNTISSRGTMRAFSTTFNSTTQSCELPWSGTGSFAQSFTTFPATVTLTRGRCYRFTFDSALLSGGAVRPTDSASNSPDYNLTSQILIVPPLADVTVPSVVPVDPRSSTVALPKLTTTGPPNARLCFYQSSSNSLTNSGNGNTGTIASTPTLTFDGATIGSQETSVLSNSQTITLTGDSSNQLETSGNFTEISNALNLINITNSSPFTTNSYVLVRAVPVYSNFTSSCTSTTADLYPNASSTKIITLKPLTVKSGHSVTVPIGPQ